MSKFEATITIADIYGAEWWERNKEELDREWEWEFSAVNGNKTYASAGREGIYPISSHANLPRIILHRRKPKPPTLREVYGKDEVSLPVGWEWAGEWREPTHEEALAEAFAKIDYRIVNFSGNPPYYRLILSKRQPNVWFRAERVTRKPRFGEWIFVVGTWVTADIGQLDNKYLCATRHEEYPEPQTVTQADIDALSKQENS